MFWFSIETMMLFEQFQPQRVVTREALATQYLSDFVAPGHHYHDKSGARLAQIQRKSFNKIAYTVGLCLSSLGISEGWRK